LDRRSPWEAPSDRYLTAAPTWDEAHERAWRKARARPPPCFPLLHGAAHCAATMAREASPGVPSSRRLPAGRAQEQRGFFTVCSSSAPRSGTVPGSPLDELLAGPQLYHFRPPTASYLITWRTGDQIASEKRRKGWTLPERRVPSGVSVGSPGSKLNHPSGGDGRFVARCPLAHRSVMAEIRAVHGYSAEPQSQPRYLTGDSSAGQRAAWPTLPVGPCAWHGTSGRRPAGSRGHWSRRPRAE
jgi:hypothetical protein